MAFPMVVSTLIWFQITKKTQDWLLHKIQKSSTLKKFKLLHCHVSPQLLRIAHNVAIWPLAAMPAATAIFILVGWGWGSETWDGSHDCFIYCLCCIGHLFLLVEPPFSFGFFNLIWTLAYIFINIWIWCTEAPP